MSEPIVTNDSDLLATIPSDRAVICPECSHLYRRERSCCPKCTNSSEPFDLAALLNGNSRLRVLRLSAQGGLSRREIALRVGVSPQRVSQILKVPR